MLRRRKNTAKKKRAPARWPRQWCETVPLGLKSRPASLASLPLPPRRPRRQGLRMIRRPPRWKNLWWALMMAVRSSKPVRTPPLRPHGLTQMMRQHRMMAATTPR